MVIRVLQALPKGFALDVWHNEVHRAIRLAGVVNRQNVRMLELRRDRDLLAEALDSDPLRQLGTEDFDGDETLRKEIARPVHGRRRPVSDLALDDISAAENARVGGR